MSLAQSAALAFIMGQHVTEENQRQAPPVLSVVVTMVPNPAKVRKVSASYKAAVASHSLAPKTEAVANVRILPTVGTLEAKGFMVAMRRAKSRDESIFAIAAYMGYNDAQDFGSQELAARTKAVREIKGTPVGGMSLDEKRAASRSVTGFVAGLPDNTKREVENLLARETTSADSLIQHEKEAADASRTTEERFLSKGLADFERDRLAHIRSDLKAMGF